MQVPGLHQFGSDDKTVLVETDEDKGETLVNQFSSVFARGPETSWNLFNYNDAFDNSSDFYLLVTPEIILKKLKTLNVNNKSPGLDEINKPGHVEADR